MIVDQATPNSFPLEVNSFDTNGIDQKPVRYYWQDAAMPFDSNSTNPALDKEKTTTDSTSWPVRAGEANEGKMIWVYARDDDGLVRGGEFVVFADSVPPRPEAYTPGIVSDSVTIHWKGMDVCEGSETEYRIVWKADADPTIDDVVMDYREGNTFENSGIGNYTYKVKLPIETPSGSGTIYYQVIARDKRLSTTQSVVDNFPY